MKLTLLSLCVLAFLSSAKGYDAEPIEGGLSPDGQFKVVNLHDGNGGFFEIESDSGDVIFSEKTLNNHYLVTPRAAEKVLWKSDSRWVAVAFGTTKFSVVTIVFHRVGRDFEIIELPGYNTNDDNDTTHRVPQKWREHGNLILEITSGYHTKSDGELSQYFQTIVFKGTPPKAFMGSHTAEHEIE